MNYLPIQVLLVANDDDFLAASALLFGIAAPSFDIQRADSPADARGHLLRNRPDVCLLSTNPQAEDAELWRELRRLAVPFLVLGGEEGEVESAVTQSGAADGLALGELSAPLLQRAIRYAIERQKLENELAQQNSQQPLPIHAHLLDVIGQAVVVTDLDGHITYWNACAQEVYGWRSSEVVGRQILEVMPNSATPSQIEAMRDLIANNRKWEGELFAQKRDGSRFPVTLSQTPVVDDAGQVVSIVALSIDISARKQAEEKLRQSEASLVKAQEIARLGSWEVDLLNLNDHVGNPLRWSDQVFRMFGYEPGQIEASNENFFRAVHPDDRERMLEAVNQAVQHSQGFTLEHRIVLPDGEQRVVRERSAIVFDESGQALRMLGTVQDITEQKRGEDLLRQSNELLRTVTEGAPDAIFAKDTEGRYLMMNTAGADLLGFSAEEVVGRTDAELLPPEVAHIFMENDLRIMAGGVVEMQDEVITVAGATRTYLATKAPLRGPNGDVVGLVGISRDISERKQAELKQEAATRAIVAAWESMTDAFFSLDTEWRFTYANAQATRMWGKEVEDVIGKTLWEAFPEVVGSEFETEYRRAVEEQMAITFESFDASHEGWREVHIYPSALGLSVYFRDTTERKNSVAAMARLAAIVESSNDAIIGRTLNGIVTSWNAGARMLYGYSAEEAMGRTISSLLPPKLAGEDSLLRERIAAGETVADFETVRFGKDGREVDISLTLSLVRDERDEVVGISSISRDIGDRKRSEASLLESARRLALATESAKIGIWDLDVVTNTLVWDAQMFALSGVAERDFQGTYQDWKNTLHPEDRERADAEANLALAKGGEFHTQFRIQWPTGEVRYTECHATIQRGEDGAARRMIGVNWDTTERKQAEDERDRFFTMSLDMLGIAGLDGHFKRLNPAWSKILGYTEAELMAEPFLSFVHPEDRAATQDVFEGMSAGNALVDFENRYRARDGAYRWLEWKAAVSVEQGLVYSAARDVTQRKENVAALLRMRDELEERVKERTFELGAANEGLLRQKTILEAQGDASIDGILIVSEAGEVVFSNRRFAEMWGFPVELIDAGLDAGLLDFVLDKVEDPQAFIARVTYLYEHQDEQSQEEISLKDGRTFDRHGAAVRGTDGTNYGWVWFFHDLTERKLAEVLIREAKEEAERANQAKSGFLSRMSHELRTPLNAILGFGQILEMHAETYSEKDQDNIAQILKAGRHLLSLINEVLDIARIEAGYLSLSLEPTPAGSVVQEALDLVRPLAAARNIRLENEVIGDNAARHLLADQQRLKQVLLNLLSNAVKYNREGGTVFVSCEITESAPILREGIRHEGTLRFLVRDTGAGLSPEDISKLFVSFERLGAARTQIEGTGIGLTLCKRLVEAMDGQVGVESELGVGSTFWVEMPLVASPLEHDAHAIEEETGWKAARAAATLEGVKTILYIEDNLSNIKLIERALSEQNYSIKLLTAMQGSVGLELAAQHAPDLILLDMHLPDITGDAVLGHLKTDAATQKIPVVVLSADATPSRVERLLSGGAEAYLTKPLDLKRFFQVVEGTMRNKK